MIDLEWNKYLLFIVSLIWATEKQRESKAEEKKPNVIFSLVGPYQLIDFFVPKVTYFICRNFTSSACWLRSGPNLRINII